MNICSGQIHDLKITEKGNHRKNWDNRHKCASISYFERQCFQRGKEEQEMKSEVAASERLDIKRHFVVAVSICYLVLV